MGNSERVDILNLAHGINRSSYITSLSQTVNRILDESYHTPDAPYLQRYDHHDVFIIGAWKKGFKRHNLLGPDIKPIGVGYTNSEQFVMYRTKGSSGYPVALITNEKDGLGGAVYGELWRIPTNRIFSLDFYESNGIESKRMKLPIRYYGTRGEIVRTYAWMWVGLRNHWNNKLEKDLILCDRQVKNSKVAGDVQKYYNYMWRYHAESNFPPSNNNTSH